MINRKLTIALAALALATVTSGARATEYKFGTVIAPAATLAAQLDAVCSSATLVLSDKASAACKSGAMPRVSASGAMTNVGLGVEFNTLIRQLPISSAAN